MNCQNRTRNFRDTSLGKAYAAGEIILRQGDSCEGMYVIQEGKAEVLHRRDDKEVRVSVLGERDFFGEVPFMERLREPGVARGTVRAVSDVRVLTVDRKTIVRRIHEDPSLAYRILET
ncbi:MAG: cyclic nucleotide-binding domain-containing protein, partial [Pseudomonadota bacterium]